MFPLENFFVKNEINLQQAHFVCMDATNINSSEKNGLKRHLEHKAPLLKWKWCKNYKLALNFKHFIPSFWCIAEINIFLLNLCKYFKYRPLVMNISGNTSECRVLALLFQYVSALLDGKHTSMHVKHSTSILKTSLIHF